MDLVLSNVSETPIYLQIYEQLSAQILNGTLNEDDCLPSIRSVARELRISVIPVKRAWEELEHGGYIYTVAGKGCFVAAHKIGELDVKRGNLATEHMKNEVDYCKTLGYTLAEIVEMVTECYNGK